MNNHAGLTLTQPTGTIFIYKRSIKLPLGVGCLGYLRPYNWALSEILNMSYIFLISFMVGPGSL